MDQTKQAKPRRTRWFLGAIIALLLYGGVRCGMGMVGMKGSYTEAEAAVEKLHAQIAQGACATIWQDADATFHNDLTQDQFEKLCRVIPRRLGAVVKSQPGGWNINANGSGTHVQMTLKTQYEKGNAEEVFVFWKHDQLMQLVRYQISSPLLLAD
jgi:hypothetical protein